MPVAALHQDVGAVGESQRRARVLLDEHDRHAGLRGCRRALRIRSRPFSATALPMARRASTPLGPTSMRAGDREHLPLPARQPPGCQGALARRSGKVSYASAIRRRAAVSARLRLRASDCRRPSATRRRSPSAARKRGRADQAMGRRMGDVATGKCNAAAADWHQAGDRLDRASTCPRRSAPVPRRSRRPPQRARRR